MFLYRKSTLLAAMVRWQVVLLVNGRIGKWCFLEKINCAKIVCLVNSGIGK